MKYIVVFNESSTTSSEELYEVYKYLESFKHWTKLNYTTYIVVSNLKPSEIRDAILKITKHYGELYVIELSDKHSVFGPDFVIETFDK